MGKTSNQTETSSSPLTGQLESVFHLAQPTMRALAAQTAEGLQTGGVNAQIPGINASVASAREAYSRSQTALSQQLATAGLGNSSFARDIMGTNSMNAGQQIAGIPSTMTNDFLARGVPTVIGAGTNALNTAAALNTSQTGTFTPSLFNDFLQGFTGGKGGSAGSDLGGMFASSSSFAF
jgi:hypothetical protein